jgi:hypothetical protein
MRPFEMPETVIPFAPSQKETVSNDGDPLDQAGQTVMSMLQRAAVAASENCQHALDVAHKLSLELRAAESRIKALEVDVSYYQDRAGRAEQWLLRISREIQQRLLAPDAGRPRQASPRQNLPYSRNVDAAE